MPSVLFTTFIQNYINSNPFESNASRRRTTLALAGHFWSLAKDQKAIFTQNSNLILQAGKNNTVTLDQLLNLPDPFDFKDPTNSIVQRRGIIVRTDFSNDIAWSEFSAIICRSEHDALVDLVGPAPSGQEGRTQDGDESGSSSEDDSDVKEEDNNKDVTMEDTPPSSIIADLAAFILYDPSQEQRPIFTNASNITLLRYFSDVDIIEIPPLPPLQGPGERRSKGSSHNPLVDCDGYQEVYEGRLLWVYDALSNSDQSLRCVSARPRSYGTATGDSWRAKARSVWELQLNMDAGTITLDFNADQVERHRNFAELGL